MALKIVIASVDVTMQIASVDIDLQGSERSTAVIETEGLIPAVDDEVVLYAKDGTTPIFGGLVRDRRVTGVSPNHPDHLVTVECVDWERVTDWCSVSLSYDTPVALEDVIADLVDEVLSDYDISYSPTATGVTLTPFTWTDIAVADAIRQLRERTNRVIRFRPNKAITVQVPGGSASPFAITDSSLWRLLRFEVGDQPRERANRVKMRFGPTGPFPTTQRWTADGVATSFEVDIQAAVGGWTQGYVREVGVADRTLSPPGGGGYYEWDETNGRGTIAVGTGAAPADDVELEFVYTGVFPFTIQLSTGATPIREYRETRTDLNQYGPALELATQVLARLDRTDARVLDIDTDQDGFEPGQALTVDTTCRGGIDAVFLVPGVSVSMVKGDNWIYTFQATEGEDVQASFQDEWRQMTGGSGGGNVSSSIAVVPGGAATGGTSPIALGGLEVFSVDASDWMDVIAMLPHVAQISFTGRVRVSLWTRESGDGVTARLFDGTTGVESSEVVSQTATEVTFLVAIVAGERYRLQIKRTTGSGEVYAGPGQLERAA